MLQSKNKATSQINSCDAKINIFSGRLEGKGLKKNERIKVLSDVKNGQKWEKI